MLSQSLCILQWNKKGQAITYVQKEDFSRMDLVYLIVKKRSCLLFFYSHINRLCKFEVGLSPFVFYGFVISDWRKGHHLSGYLIFHGPLKPHYCC